MHPIGAAIGARDARARCAAQPELVGAIRHDSAVTRAPTPTVHKHAATHTLPGPRARRQPHACRHSLSLLNLTSHRKHAVAELQRGNHPHADPVSVCARVGRRRCIRAGVALRGCALGVGRRRCIRAGLNTGLALRGCTLRCIGATLGEWLSPTRRRDV